MEVLLPLTAGRFLVSSLSACFSSLFAISVLSSTSPASYIGKCHSFCVFLSAYFYVSHPIHIESKLSSLSRSISLFGSFLTFLQAPFVSLLVNNRFKEP